jgi:hypothetical protein
MVRVVHLLLALARCQRRKVDIDGNRLVVLARARAEDEELAACVGRDRLNRGDVERLAKVVRAPAEALVGRVEDLARRDLVAGRGRRLGQRGMSYTVESQNRLQDELDDDDDAAVVAKLPQMGVLVDLLPRQAGVAREESVAVAVSWRSSWGQHFAQLANRS